MKKIIYDERYIIGVFFLLFAIAIGDLLQNPTVIYNWFGVLHWYGKTAVVLMTLDLIWLFLAMFIKNRF